MLMAKGNFRMLAKRDQIQRKKVPGFTLIELLIVVVILGIIAAIVISVLQGSGAETVGFQVNSEEVQM
jgi:prepilin-type N-terminal cleavage/methylation domain-containing protein